MTTNQQQKTQITRYMTIEEILTHFPYKAQKLAQEITNAGLHCVGCCAASTETLEAGMYGHQMTDEQINQLVDRLNVHLNEQEPDADTITITKKAAQKFLQILEEEGKLGWSLRFGEKLAGCSGFEYVLDFSEKALPTDKVYKCNEIEIHIDNMLVPHLQGSEIDFVDSLQNSGFKVTNRRVRSACGCGSSHGY
jgi:iron-sulfur cluster assembly protein